MRQTMLYFLTLRPYLHLSSRSHKNGLLKMIITFRIMFDKKNKLNTKAGGGSEERRRRFVQVLVVITLDQTHNRLKSCCTQKYFSSSVKQVAFSASLMASGGGDIGPFNAYTSLIFRNVVSNVGNAYNPNTGFFTAPVRGVYHFNYHIYGHGHPSHGSGAVLVKNGEYIFMAYEHQTTLGANSANTVTFLLEGGDVVYLLQRAHTRIFDDQLHYTTFSGLLLFPLCNDAC
uniref:C1q domain-containing protein n=1 Tax=Xiphophorus maculatus TaxID=8083 RepID=M4AXC8_XIPMA